MLLRTGVHVRAELQLPAVVRVREREEAVVVSQPASTRPPPVSETVPASGKALARELLVMLGERRAELLGFVRRRVRSGADAEDLLQQALVRAAEKLDGLRSGDRVDAWFYRVLRNTIADHHAAWATREAKLEELARDALDAPPEDAAVCACSLGLLEDIRPEYAAILRHVDIDEESLAVVAERLGITVTNAKVRLHRARRSLREALERRCGTSSIRACQDCSCSAGTTAR